MLNNIIKYVFESKILGHPYKFIKMKGSHFYIFNISLS